MTTTTPKAEETPQQRFIQHLFKRDAGERAELRRCLAADKPSAHLPAYRLVETQTSVKGARTAWERECYYLVAGLFALVERRPPQRRGRTEGDEDVSGGKLLTLAKAVRVYEGHSEKGEGNMSSVERRFLALLDSDQDQLPYRLRQILLMVTRGQNAVAAPLDWAKLLKDLQYWSSASDWVRQEWARDFYQPSDNIENQASEESQS